MKANRESVNSAFFDKSTNEGEWNKNLITTQTLIRLLSRFTTCESTYEFMSVCKLSNFTGNVKYKKFLLKLYRHSDRELFYY